MKHKEIALFGAAIVLAEEIDRSIEIVVEKVVHSCGSTHCDVEHASNISNLGAALVQLVLVASGKWTHCMNVGAVQDHFRNLRVEK